MKRLPPPIERIVDNLLKRANRMNSQPERHPKRAGSCCLAALAAALMCLVASARAASVGPSGYTNDFSVRPIAPGAADFATSSGIVGSSSTISSPDMLDSYVQGVAASSITTQVTDSSPANPPVKLASAQWTSGGSAYLMTRPTGNAATLLMATLVNNTGTNCNTLHLNYQLTVGASVFEEVLGQRLYYSFSTASNTWTSLPGVSGVNASSLVSTNVPLNQTWNNGSNLYLLWADDNAIDSTESAYEIDNFFAAAYYTYVPLTVALTAPANGQLFALGSPISASIALTGSSTNVSYYVDGNLAVVRTVPPFTPVTLPAQAAGSHTIYATAQDANDAFLTTVTNTFVVQAGLNGTLLADTTLDAANGPYLVDGNLTVPAGITLTIGPGTTVLFGAGVRVTVNGLITAAGTPGNRIRLTRAAGSNWGGFNFSANHQSNIFAYVDFEYAGSGGAVFSINNAQVTFERDTFLKMTGVSYMNIYYPQVIIRHSVFGDAGNSGMIAVENLDVTGWFIVDGNLFGSSTGDTDIFHLNHISVKNGPKAILVNNVFIGAGDDQIDDNESDSHIEGNLFLNATTNHPLRSASCAVTTGEGTGVSTNLHTQRLVVVRNIFWGNDYGIINKDGSAVEVYNCVFVNNRGGIILDEPWRNDSGPGRTCYIEGSIFWNNWAENGTDQGALAYLNDPAAFTTGRYYRGNPQVTVNNCIIPAQYHHLGTGNIDADPMFVFPTNLMNLSATNPAFAGGFDGFDANAFLFANHLIPDVHLLPGSPATGAGFNGSDMGVYVSDNATVTGESASPTTEGSASLAVAGLDIAGYKYRLVGPGFTNAWSQELQQWKYVSAITLAGTTATATATNHGFANGDVIEVIGADALCPYYNGMFTVQNVTANTFTYTVAPGTNLLTGEPLTIGWPGRYNETWTDIWCRKPQKVQLTGLTDGTYRVEVVRQNSMGVWQDTANPTVSKPWTVNLGGPLRLSAPQFSGSGFTFRFNAVAGQTYSVEYRNIIGSSTNWLKLEDIPAVPATGDYTVTNGAPPNPSRFYRVVTPAQM